MKCPKLPKCPAHWGKCEWATPVPTESSQVAMDRCCCLGMWPLRNSHGTDACSQSHSLRAPRFRHLVSSRASFSRNYSHESTICTPFRPLIWSKHNAVYSIHIQYSVSNLTDRGSFSLRWIVHTFAPALETKLVRGSHLTPG